MSDPKWTIRLAATNLGQVFSEPLYVQRYKPASMDKHGRYRKDGALVITPIHAEALFFDTSGDALKFARQTNGYRPDGSPNRPLCSYMLDVSQDEQPSMSSDLLQAAIEAQKEEPN